MVAYWSGDGDFSATLYIQQLRKVILLPFRNIVTVCKQVTLLKLYYISSRLVTLLKFVGTPIQFSTYSLSYSVWWAGVACHYGWTIQGSNPSRRKIFCTCREWPWGPPSLLYDGYQFLSPGVKWPGHGTDQPLPSSAFSPPLPPPQCPLASHLTLLELSVLL